MCGSLLVAHINNLDALSNAPVHDRHDVATREREYNIHALGLERSCNHLSAADLCHCNLPTR
jgi:hypothetical protein